MVAGELCTTKVQTVRSTATVVEAARKMKRRGVGSLVVAGRQGPVEGILTDRDIVVRWVARGAPEGATVGEVMTGGMVAIAEDTPLEQAMEVMADCKVRRLVVTDPWGDLVGILALDDILERLNEEPEPVRRLLRDQVLAKPT